MEEFSTIGIEIVTFWVMILRIKCMHGIRPVTTAI